MDRVWRVFGKPGAGAIINVTTQAMERWKARGGLVPAKHQKKFLAAAASRGLALSAEDLIGEPRP